MDWYDSYHIGVDQIDAQHNKELHRKLIDDVKRIPIDLKKGKNADTGAFVDFMIDWLINHIRQQDKKIGKAVAKWRISSGSPLAIEQSPEV